MTAVANQKVRDIDVDEAVRALQEPTADEIQQLDAWRRANNYLTIGQIYLRGNPLLREPLAPEHIKPRLPEVRDWSLGDWATRG